MRPNRSARPLLPLQPPRVRAARLVGLVGSLVALVVVLVSCASDAAPRLHDVYIHDGASSQRVTYVYGTPGPFPDPDTIAGLVELTAPAPGEARRPPGSAPVVPGSLDIGGEAYRTTDAPAVERGFTVSRIPLTTDLRLETQAAYDQILYFDGGAWLTLAAPARAGLATRVAPRPRVGRLRGAGELSDAEADAWADALEAGGEPVVVAVLSADALPERELDGVDEYLRTGLVVQRGLDTDVASFTPPPDDVVWEEVARGQRATAIQDPGYELIRDRASLASVWSRVYSGRLDTPPLPEVDFDREAIVTIYRGEEPTGGYGIEIERMTLEDGDVYVDVAFTDPAPGASVTQALTSPWLMVRILHRGVDVVWFRDPDSGRLLAVARAL